VDQDVERGERGRRTSLARRRLGPWCVAAGLLAWPASAAPPLVQLPGTAGCVSDTGTAGACADGVSIDYPVGVVVSPDGRNVYVASFSDDAVLVFDRNVSTGVLTQKAGTAGCASETGTGGVCADARALDGPQSVAVSPDGRSVYVASSGSGAVAVFDRDVSTGALNQKGAGGCVSETGTGGACTDGLALSFAVSVAVSPDGRSVYVGAISSDAVAVFDRDVSTGALTQKAGTAGCVSETGTGGLCADGVALDFPEFVTVTPDGPAFTWARCSAMRWWCSTGRLQPAP
jgi:DNA-binding beta-propeller fold protein YncE